MMRAGSLIKGFLLACLAAALMVAPLTAAALSLEDEEKLGREFVADVKKHFPLVEDEFALDYLNRLGGYLAGAVETKPFPFSFYLIPRNEMNAFAGPGGHIFFFTGLIESMDTVDELAAVASHEMAHITARHLSKRIEQNKKLSMATLAGVLIGALVGGEAAQAIMIGSAAAGAQAQLAFSRTDERQADQLGFQYMRRTGFDPAAMIEVLKRMQSAQIYGTDKVPAYLRTHPTGPERMANMDNLLSSGSQGAGTDAEERLRSEYPLFRTLLIARHGDPEVARRRFRNEIDEHPDAALAHFGLGLLDKEASEYDAAVGHLERSLELRPDLLPVRNHLGEAYQYTGRYKDAIPVLESVLDGDPDNRKALFLLATSYQNLEAYARAARIYERLLGMEPVREDVSYNLGLCYGRMDRLPLAHYHFGVFFKKTGKPAKARFHFEKAEELGRHDMELVHKIRKAREDLP
ncbi:MAG: M48 family metalloprotease [Deltaproteobacteria bacterium]|nr:M48 family metalloprotease [Deltaproteobacteria bacterium]